MRSTRRHSAQRRRVRRRVSEAIRGTGPGPVEPRLVDDDDDPVINGLGAHEKDAAP